MPPPLGFASALCSCHLALVLWPPLPREIPSRCEMSIVRLRAVKGLLYVVRNYVPEVLWVELIKVRYIDHSNVWSCFAGRGFGDETD